MVFVGTFLDDISLRVKVCNFKSKMSKNWFLKGVK